ncbi:hexose transporter protein [Myriangium duriaei CBS 260.36]|uniref:Hexose transporter protein n=1 Tax=Myriangium duriaei CBS 260.36 TaxID=1168546 RepID=A0A9P4J2S5_9PEZI|nr:hexose transporter protein [Myriangium duriaei CBS 260.36]
MGGGAQPIGRGYFKAALAETPREAFNWRFYYCVLNFGLMGAARGLDEGLIGTTVTQKSFIKQSGLSTAAGLTAAEVAQKTGNITAMVQIGSVLGALIAFTFSDRIGRLWATRELCTVWIIGAIVFLTSNGSYGQVLAGRFIMGCGIGQTTVVAPSYLAEISPRSVRGVAVCAFTGSVYVGIMLGYFANYGTSLHIGVKSLQWIAPQSMHIIFAGIIFIMSFFALESPRWLMRADRIEDAAMTMSKLRNLDVEDPYVRAELTDIQDQLSRERAATAGNTFTRPFKELFTLPRNRYPLVLALMLQLLGQWSGANSVTIYAPAYFAILGIKGSSEGLLATGVLGVVKLLSALTCAFFLVDFLGRKRALSIGICIQFISMLYIAITLTSIPVLTSAAAKTGSVHLTSMQRHASTGAIVFVYFSGVGWALGYNSIQYLLSAEVFPLGVRSLGQSLVMCFHFVNQYGNSKAVPLMLLSTENGGITSAGTFWFFAVVTGLGGAFVWFFMPETAGKSLEGMDELFSLPWHQIGRKGAKLTAGKGSMLESLATAGGAKEFEMMHVEHAEEHSKA